MNEVYCHICYPCVCLILKSQNSCDCYCLANFGT
uniref:Uncharacterized protein n=1 Tax=Arundo donax TaxID=35708 RepID=A0A0A8ZY17_ARUDO